MSKHVRHKDDEQLARWTHEMLRSLPPRRAPDSLEGAVLARIARAERPWWARGFAHWPAIARALFLIASIGIARLAMLTVDAVFKPIGEQLPERLTPDLTWFQVAIDTASTVVQSIPSLWLYAGLGAIATLYALFFGLGATAYRALYAGR